MTFPFLVCSLFALEILQLVHKLMITLGANTIDIKGSFMQILTPLSMSISRVALKELLLQGKNLNLLEEPIDINLDSVEKSEVISGVRETLCIVILVIVFLHFSLSLVS